jgi:glyoxylase-like metal-dependent hydrolase (beta-lactamase superfamily II)
MAQKTQREKIADNVYFFQSDSYALVTAGVILGPQWAVVIDTLPFPEETLEMLQFVEENNLKVRYVINTHYHADHTWGNCFFPNATIIAHELCRQRLEERGIPSLEETRKQNMLFKNVHIVLPHITFSEGSVILQVGKKNIHILLMPGHSADGIGVFVEEDRVLITGDAFMELPFIVDGNIDDMVRTIKMIAKLGLENIIQGHGNIILRGEIDGAIKENLVYLESIRREVEKSHKKEYPGDYLQEVSVEDCGKSHILIGGLAQQLHQRNLRALYRQMYGVLPAMEEYDDE